MAEARSTNTVKPSNHTSVGAITETSSNKVTDAALSQIFRDIGAHQAQEIREAYYKTVQGLMTLAEALVIADAQQTESAGPLLTKHFPAVKAHDAMKQCQKLG